jgi:hypothetical protein
MHLALSRSQRGEDPPESEVINFIGAGVLSLIFALGVAADWRTGPAAPGYQGC